jgi:molybdopterin adenylyltransferase
MCCGRKMAYEQHTQSARSERARCAVITLSDTRDEASDTSGRAIRTLLESHGHVVVHYAILKDDAALLDAKLLELLGSPDVDAILTNGGTGISRRDQAIAVIEKHIDQPLPGFGELFRMLSWEQIGSGAMLSRAVGGVARGQQLIFAMPGSTKAVELAMTRLILPELKHLLGELHK